MTIDLITSEVGPRDGLQSIEQIMPTDTKMAWIKAQFEAGTPEIEVGSFVPPRVLPQMADTADVVAFANTLEGLEVAVLAPNLKGLENAVAAGAHKASVPFSMSETHSLKNVRKKHAEMLQEITRCVAYLDMLPDQQKPKFEVGLSTALGCTIEGHVPEERFVAMAEKVNVPTILITGANSGTGIEFACQYGADGRKVVACCRHW